MIEKYRLHEVAKDLGVASKEVVDLLAERIPGERKSMTALNEQELSVILNHYTNQNQVESFDEYFAAGEAKKQAAKEAARKAAEQARAAAQEAARKTAEEAARKAAPAQQPAAQQGGQGRAQQSQQRPQQGQSRSQQGQQNGRTQGRAQQGSQQRPQQGQGRPQQGQQNGRAQGRAQQGGQQRPQQGQGRPQQQRPQQGGQPASSAQQPGTKPRQRGSAMVDMRAGSTQVELDRYNEKYDTLAQTKMGNRDTGAQKQKLTQRSAQRRSGKPAMSRKEKEDAKMRRLELERQRRQKLEITIPDEITVGELAARLHLTASEVIKRLMGLGVMAAVNDVIDYDTAAMVSMEIGAKVEKEVVVTIEDRLFKVDEEDGDENLVERPPIVVVMGHVDHGKTSLLDAIRQTNVTEGEAGGITQHIGAYSVELNGQKITFLDTPGHEAFTAMRARGAKITDVAIIIVAADDSVMPQTIEAINHAQAAGVPMVFAINKIDKPQANPDHIKEQLSQMNYLVESWGGKYQDQEISAKQGLNLDKLLEKVLLEAEMLDLKANPNKRAVGTVIESTLDKGRGYVSTILVQSGTLRVGDVILSGVHTGRVKAMFNENGKKVTEAGPSTPVQVLGLNGAPQAGDTFNVMEDDRSAREIANKRSQLQRMQGIMTQKHVTLDEIGRRIAIGSFKELNIIVKGDVDGSVEAMSGSLIKLSKESVQVNVIHAAVGQISESDVLLAAASNAIIVGFQVRPSAAARRVAEKEEIEIRLYSIIYDAINDIKDAIEGMLEPVTKEEIVCSVEVLEIFKITKVGTVAGCVVREGKLQRTTPIRVIRDGIVIYTGKLGSLKRFKDDVKEVSAGQDCGLNIESFNDIRIGDIVEGYEQVEVKRK